MAEPVKSLSKAIAVLRTVCDAPAAPAELARVLALDLSAVLRIVGTFEREGVLTRLPSGRYQVSTNLVMLVGRWNHLAPSAEAVHDVLTRLRDLTGETAYLVVRAGDQRLVVDAVESRHEIRAAMESGLSMPILPGGTGCVLLADEKAADVNRLRARLGPGYREGAGNVAEEGRLTEELRQQGFLVTRPPYAGGVALATALRSSDGLVTASLAVTGPSNRWTVEQAYAFGARLVSAAEELSAAVTPYLAVSRG